MLTRRQVKLQVLEVVNAWSQLTRLHLRIAASYDFAQQTRSKFQYVVTVQPNPHTDAWTSAIKYVARVDWKNRHLACRTLPLACAPLPHTNAGGLSLHWAAVDSYGTRCESLLDTVRDICHGRGERSALYVAGGDRTVQIVSLNVAAGRSRGVPALHTQTLADLRMHSELRHASMTVVDAR